MRELRLWWFDGWFWNIGIAKLLQEEEIKILKL